MSKVFVQSVFFICCSLLVLGNSSYAQDLQTSQFEHASKYEAVQTFLTQLNQQYPGNTEMFDLGLNDDGVMIRGIKIGRGSLHNLVVATHHGNEYGSTEVAKAFAAALAKEPLADQTVYVIPVLNINGYNRGSRLESALGRSHDPNRDYPGPCGSDGPYNLKSTKLLSDFLEKENIISSLTLHTYYPVVAYPWGFSTHDTKTADQDFFTYLVKLATQFSQYPAGNSGEIIYPADGTFEDFAYWKYGIWSLLFEIGQSHSPSPQQIEKMIRENLPGMKLVLKNSQTQRSKNFAFTGKCDHSLRALDLRNE